MQQYITINGLQYPLCPEDKIPTDDPNLPSFVSAEYEGCEEDLELVTQIYRGKIKHRLDQWEREPDKAFKGRQKRTLFQNFFKIAVNGFPGFLSDIRNTENLFQGLQDYIEDVDGCGTDLKSFLWQADLKVIRDGYCGILVDAPKSEGIETLADLKKVTSPRPYLVLIDRENILSGFESDKRITFTEYVTEDVGDYGSHCYPRFKTFYRDGSYRVEVILIKDEEPYKMEIDSGFTSLKQLPLILYSATDINPSQAEPPLLNLAEKNEAHYQLFSEYRESMHRMNNATAVRIGVVSQGQTDFSNLPPLVLGANTAIDVPIGGDFKFEEPTGAALATDRNELDKLEVSMHLDTLRFATTDSSKTATQAILESAATQATLSGMATLKESMIERLAALWAEFMGAKGQGGKCTVSKDLMTIPLSSMDMDVLAKLAVQDQLSTITLLELLSEGKRLPQGVNPALEIKRIAAEITVKNKRMADVLKLNSNNANNTNAATKDAKNQD